MRRFLGIWLFCLLLLLTATAMLNVVVDPYWVFGTSVVFMVLTVLLALATERSPTWNKPAQI